jgi:hypothetical protein
MKTWMMALALLALSGSAFAGGKQIYKWKDAAGVTHYGSKPPASVAADKTAVTVGPSNLGDAPTSAAQADVSAKNGAAKPTTSGDVAAQRREFCAKIRNNIGVLQSAASVDYADKAGGEKRTLTETERAAKLADAMRQEKDTCGAQ